MTDPRVIQALRQERRRRGAPRKHLVAGVATGLVESNLENLPGGDADSAGWRQERASLYANPTNLAASVKRFFDEAAQQDRPGIGPGELAARVQRPAAQYRGRYRQRVGDARGLLGITGTGAQNAPGATGGTTFDQGGFDQANRKSIVGQFLARSHGTDSVLFRSGLLSTASPDRADFTSRSAPDMPGIPGPGPGIDSGRVGAAVTAARQRLGVREVGSSNRSQAVDEMQKSFGMIGQPWCGIFVGTALRAAGVSGVNSRIASVAAIEQDAKAGQGPFRAWVAPRDAKPGDALVTRAGGHVVLVESVDRKRGLIRTIGGNTGNGAVQRVTYRMNSVHGAARPRYR